MSTNVILAEQENGIAVLTINRPESMNSIDVPALLEMEQVFMGLESDDEVRVIIFTGAGDRAFIAGGDISDLNSRAGLAHYQEFAEVIHRVMRRIERCDKPTISAVNGWALGGGTELLLATDMRVLADNARLGLPEITLGIIPGAGGTQRLIRQVPLCRAKEIMFTGNHIDAEAAVAMGLANRVVPKAELMSATKELAATIAKMSPLILKVLKRALNDGGEMPLSAALAHEQIMASIVFDSEDAHEGCSAFLEKREPQFKGR